MRKVLPVLLALVGLGAGGGAGLLFRPGPDVAGGEGLHAPVGPEDHGAAAPDDQAAGAHAASPPPDDGSVEMVKAHDDPHDASGAAAAGHDYVKLSNQFVVPIVDQGQVASMIVVTLSLEVTPGGGDAVYAREPKLRDALLQVLFDHANADGFRGRFTDAEAMLPLRRALREAAVKVLPDTVQDVLISDILRHDS